MISLLIDYKRSLPKRYRNECNTERLGMLIHLPFDIARHSTRAFYNQASSHQRLQAIGRLWLSTHRQGWRTWAYDKIPSPSPSGGVRTYYLYRTARTWRIHSPAASHHRSIHLSILSGSPNHPLLRVGMPNVRPRGSPSVLHSFVQTAQTADMCADILF